MTREREIKILIEDGCTKSDAEKHLKNGTIIFEDFKENFESYMEEWKDGFAEEDFTYMVESYKKMVETGKPVMDWGVVKFEGKTYYIMYAL